MSVQHATIASAPSIPPISPPSPLLHIRTDTYAGRKYHASSVVTENTDLLGACAPFAYTIWKRFRNEVCAECWRYDRGRRSFLTRRDDEGFGGVLASGATQSCAEEGDQGTRAGSTVGAGLWFCNATCQRSWIAREGSDAVNLLRRLEGVRQTKSKSKSKPGAEEHEDRGITRDVADGAWDAVCAEERSAKGVRRWQGLLLDDYETDMARYVLLALLRCHRERCDRYACGGCPSLRHEATVPGDSDVDCTEAKGGCEQDSEWGTFASLQTNELSLLRACPEILDHQTRVYRLLRSLFCGFGVAAYPMPASSSRSILLSALPSPNGSCSTAEDAARNLRGDRPGGDSADRGRRPALGDVITVANVRRALGVDAGNSFGIWEVPLTDESECLGFAVYPVASFFNHHCSPNVRKVRDGRTLRFLTACAVEKNEELCISYGHVEGMDWSVRQKELLEGWYFSCRCSRCRCEGPGAEC
ncbi:hypothetical protein LXA43DRAFT_986109 [Ganoderma leucocontextum]|nr:hypothetical protein LXA43DRAFT_986109 [Ganoderma leucocontextum]